MPRVFLTAEWRNLIIVSYHVPSALIEAHLPRGLEPDPIGEGGARGEDPDGEDAGRVQGRCSRQGKIR